MSTPVANVPLPVQANPAAPVQAQSVLLDPLLIEQISKSGQDIFNAAAPKIVTHTNTAIDVALGASEVAAKVAINAKVATVAPSLAPFVAPCVNSGTEVVCEQARKAAHEQVESCVTNKGPVAVDSCVKGSAGAVNLSYQKACV